MIRRDFPEVLAIENAGFDHPWSEEDFLSALRQRNCIGMVAELDERVVGFFVHELHKGGLVLLNFAVAPDLRHRGVGRQMAEKLVGKLASHRRKLIRIDVRETNLAAQLFFQVQGFRAVAVLREHFADTGEAAFRMEYRIDREDF
jgi:ribosomal-protein-alanine N-acetyltransferase